MLWSSGWPFWCQPGCSSAAGHGFSALRLPPAKARQRWREDFYDHFLDGAAGVMYTSFLGLILDDLIALGTGKYKKC